MPQVARGLKKSLLLILPRGARMKVLSAWPNLRKAAPEGMEFVFPAYLGDVRVRVNTRYKVERIMWSGRYEPSLLRFLEQRAPTGWRCCDVGANVGAITLALAKYGGPDARVHAFEPGPPNLQRLRANLELNPDLAARVEVIPAGVGDEPGELRWGAAPGNPGNALLGAEGTHVVPVVTLDGFVRERGIQRLDFIKIDVEGMELAVMKGARQTLQQLRPRLYFETLARYGGLHDGGNFSLIEQLLVKECNYRLHRLDTEGNLHAVQARFFTGYTVAVPGESP